jgi:hypothetical protein
MRFLALVLTSLLIMLAVAADNHGLTEESTSELQLAPFYLVWLGPDAKPLEDILPLNEMADVSQGGLVGANY